MSLAPTLALAQAGFAVVLWDRSPHRAPHFSRLNTVSEFYTNVTTKLRNEVRLG
uniref:Uncharacterized protein n=1 Tax=Anguilla anguilla TaxID=7936 RepID=A0A0E9VJR6_ANGAN